MAAVVTVVETMGLPLKSLQLIHDYAMITIKAQFICLETHQNMPKVTFKEVIDPLNDPRWPRGLSGLAKQGSCWRMLSAG